MGKPLRVDISNLQVPTVGRMTRVGPQLIPIPAYNVAYANLDTFGQPTVFAVPPYGAIVAAQFYDYAYQGIGKELWLTTDISVINGVSADNAAFSMADIDSLNVQGVITFAVWKDSVNNYQGQTADLPFWYYAPKGVLYGLWKTLGADTIASAAVNPYVALTIEAYAGPA